MSHICQSAVLMKNNLTQQKGLNTIFSLLMMTKIDSYMESKSWMLLFPNTSIRSYLENKLLKPLSPIQKNYPEISTNNGPSSYTTANVKESTGYQAMPQSTLFLKKHRVLLLNAALYEKVDLALILLM